MLLDLIELVTASDNKIMRLPVFYRHLVTNKSTNSILINFPHYSSNDKIFASWNILKCKSSVSVGLFGAYDGEMPCVCFGYNLFWINMVFDKIPLVIPLIGY